MTAEDDRAREIAANALRAIEHPVVAPQPIVARRPPYIFERVNERTGAVTIGIDFLTYATFLKNHLSIQYFNKTIYIYDHGKHFYRQHTNEIETHIRNTVDDWGIGGKLAPMITEMMAHIKAMGCHADYPFNFSSDKIPVENGIVKIDYNTGEISLLAHSPEFLFTYKLSVEYDPKMRPCNAIMLLKRMVEPEDIKTLVQIPAQSLLQMQMNHSFKKAYLLQGEPHAGKTSYLKLLYEIFGADFRAGVPLQQLCDDKFVGGALEGKLLNIFDDLEDVALNEIAQFKNLTGDINHSIERKYESRYSGRITAVHCFTCNYPPDVPAKVKRDAAFWARWEYLRFPFAYPINPNFYGEWYTKERISAFFNLILNMMIHIRRCGLVSNSDVQEVMQVWNVNADPMYEFIAQLLEPTGASLNNYHFSKTKFFHAYLQWCNDSGIPEHKRKQTLPAFTVALQVHGIVPSQKKENKKIYETYSTTQFVKRAGCRVDLHYITTIDSQTTPVNSSERLNA